MALHRFGASLAKVVQTKRTKSTADKRDTFSSWKWHVAWSAVNVAAVLAIKPTAATFVAFCDSCVFVQRLLLIFFHFYSFSIFISYSIICFLLHKFSLNANSIQFAAIQFNFICIFCSTFDSSLFSFFLLYFFFRFCIIFGRFCCTYTHAFNCLCVCVCVCWHFIIRFVSAI